MPCCGSATRGLKWHTLVRASRLPGQQGYSADTCKCRPDNAIQGHPNPGLSPPGVAAFVWVCE